MSDKNKAELFRISIAQINIEIECYYRTVILQCKNYLNVFDTPDMLIKYSFEEVKTEEPDFPIIEESEESYEGVATTRFYGGAESLFVLRKISEKMLSFNIFLMHGAVVAFDNNAYMFTAPSGVGKTTRIKLWCDLFPESIVVNGDKPLIKIDKTQAIACGTPWCGKEGWNTNTMVSLRAIFLLERVEDGEEDSIEEVPFKKAFPRLLSQVYCPKDPELMKKTIFLLKSLDGKVKFYSFHSSPTRRSVQLAYEIAKP